MKLIHKTNRYYLLSSLVLLILGGFGYYFLLSNMLRHELDESLLYSRAKLLQLNEENYGEINMAGDVFKIRSIPMADSFLYFRDAILEVYDFEEQKFSIVPARQLVFSLRAFNGNSEITLSRSTIEQDDLLQAILIVSLLFLLLFLLLIFLLNRFVLQRLWEPFYHNLAQIEAFDLNQSEPLNSLPSSVDEFQQLTKVLSSMTAKMKQDYISLQQFSENAAHELQTPLANLQSQLDLLLQDNLAEATHNRLSRMQVEIRRLGRLNHSLLLLTKIENHQYPQRRKLALAPLINDQLDQFAPLVENQALQLEVNLSEVHLRVNPDLLPVLLRNLLINAIRHSQPNGKLNVYLDSEQLTIKNTGAAPAVLTAQLFERFQKGDPSGPSTGLGLPIALEICKLHDWRLVYDYQDGWHQLQLIW